MKSVSPLVVALLAAAVLALRAQGSVPAQNPRVVTTLGPESFVSRVVATDLAGPWEVTWGPDGFLWITERVGKRITRVNPADGSKTVAVTIDEVYQTLAQAGFLESTRTLRLQPVHVSPEVLGYLRDHHEEYVLRCIQVSP